VLCNQRFEIHEQITLFNKSFKKLLFEISLSDCLELIELKLMITLNLNANLVYLKGWLTLKLICGRF